MTSVNRFASLVIALWGCAQTKAPAPGVFDDPTSDVRVDDTGFPAFADQDQDGHDASVDCDDTDATVFPGADEWCNDVDDDCDGEVDDDAIDHITVYIDKDDDGFGSDAVSMRVCEVPAGFSTSNSDCDDRNAAVNPISLEFCNDIDDNCDGVVDTDAVNQAKYSVDRDGDGYGSPDETEFACSPDGYVLNDQDCDDANPDVHPGATETWWDFTDNDCNGIKDDMIIDDVADTQLTGDLPGDYISFDGLAIVDMDADGEAELAVGSQIAGFSGAVWGIESAKGIGVSDEIGNVASSERRDFTQFSFTGYLPKHVADVTGDGEANFVIGSSDAVFAGGHIYVYDGDGAEVQRFYGSSVPNASSVLADIDYNGDGIAEIATGDWNISTEPLRFNGRAYLMDAPAMGPYADIADADLVVTGGTNFGYLGQRTGGGDLDGDGYDDLLVSAPGLRKGSGGWYIFYGDAKTWHESGPAVDVADARIIGNVGDAMGLEREPPIVDVTGDGKPELFVSGSENGAVYAFDGPGRLSGDVAAATAELIIDGSAAPDYFGFGLDAGDADGDGVADLWIGAPDEDYAGIGDMDEPGQVFLFRGASLAFGGTTLDSTDADARIEGDSAMDLMGFNIAMGDWNNDGFDDVAIGQPNWDWAVETRGRVNVVLGGP